jgi:hypothetical protein
MICLQLADEWKIGNFHNLDQPKSGMRKIVQIDPDVIMAPPPEMTPS